MTALRVLHCPTMVGGNPQALARAERELGLQSWSVSLERTVFDYVADQVLPSRPLWRRELNRWPLLWQALRDYDIIHFNCGKTILPQRPPPLSSWHRLFRVYAGLFELQDLPLLKRAGKGIVVTYQGDDARQGDFCLANFEISPAQEVEPGYYSSATDAEKRKRIATFARYADRIYALNPDLLHVLPPQTEFLPYANVDMRDWHEVGKKDSSSAIPVIVHAPSHRRVKGTRYILDAVSRLQSEGIALEFILVEGVANVEARRIYERADLLIDQMLCGWYGGLAVELMALGKPVMCYLRQDDLRFIPLRMRQELPIINVTPSTLYDTLKQWLTVRKHELAQVGQKGCAFVETWHNPLTIAARLKKDYESILAAKSMERQH